ALEPVLPLAAGLGLFQPAEERDGDRIDDFLFALEISIDRRALDPEPLAELTRGQRVETRLVDDVPRRLDDHLAREPHVSTRSEHDEKAHRSEFNGALSIGIVLRSSGSALSRARLRRIRQEPRFSDVARVEAERLINYEAERSP